LNPALKRFEFTSYFFLVLGSVLDHLTTIIAKRIPQLYEANPHAAWMMERGLYLHLDALIITLLIIVHAVIMRKWKRQDRWTLLFTPLTVGVLRLATAISNTLLILTVTG